MDGETTTLFRAKSRRFFDNRATRLIAGLGYTILNLKMVF